MFILTDCTKSFPNDIVCNDVKDLRNIVLGITDDDTIADAAYNAVCNMTFGDSYMVNPLFAIDCVRATRSPESWKKTSAGATKERRHPYEHPTPVQLLGHNYRPAGNPK